VVRRAPKTCYFLNRTAGYLALIGRRVRIPGSVGFWIPIADGDREPSHVVKMLAANYPDLQVEGMPLIALLSDFDVDAFEKELAARELLKPAAPLENE
jgi:hypothetical protein